MDALSRLDIDSLKVQGETEEVLKLLSGLENNSTNNNKFPMHTALFLKEQSKVKNVRLREKSLSQAYYSKQHIEGYDLLCYKDEKRDLHSPINDTKNTVFVS
jgi:hypothetical protein